MLFLLGLLILISNSIIYVSSDVSHDETGWWNTITSHIPLWSAEEKTPGNSDDNDQEIENSVKLTQLFPTLKEKLESFNVKDREEAKEFIKKMNTQIKERKRYTHMLWKGVKTVIDMGRLESNERRSNEKQVNIFWQIINGVINFFKWMFGLETTDDKKDEHNKDKKHKHGNSSTEKKEENGEHSHVHLSTHHSAPSTDLKAGLKDDLDHFDGNPEEFIHGDRKPKPHKSNEDESPQSSDPKAGIKNRLDLLDSSEPVEFIHTKEHTHSGETKSAKHSSE